MSERTIHMLAGLPRSGSTLLCNLLMQNPAIHATPTSALSGVLAMIRDQWDAQPGHRAHDNHDRTAAMRAFAHAYHPTDRPIAVDKSRGWPAQAELSREVIPEAKLIVTVRSIPEVLASMEQRWRETRRRSTPPDQREYPMAFATVQSRCQHWMQAGGIVGGPYNQIVDAMRREVDMLFVDFDELTANPLDELGQIYRHLELDWFAHDPSSVEDCVMERDQEVHGYTDLHSMTSSAVEPVRPKAVDVLGRDVVQQYANLDFWRQSDGHDTS